MVQIRSITVPTVQALQLAVPESKTQELIDGFLAQAAEKLPGHDPKEIRLGALHLWEKSLADVQDLKLPSTAGRLTGYLTALQACTAALSGPTAAPIAQALNQLQPEGLFTQHANGFTYLDGGTTAKSLFGIQSALENGPTKLAGFDCTGLWNQQEAALLEASLTKLKDSVPHLTDKLKGVAIHTWIGTRDIDNPFREQVQGNVDNLSPGYLKLSREGIRGQELDHFLFHEFAHVTDAIEGEPNPGYPEVRFKSELKHAFCAKNSPVACVSAYARTATAEDYAETFAYCLQNRETIQAHPDIYFHGLGQLSQKLSDIFQEQFKVEIPPPSPNWENFRQKVQTGQSPFGFHTETGKLKSAGAQVRYPLKDLAIDGKLQNIEDRIAKEPPGAYRDQLRFLHAELLGGPALEVQPTPPRVAQISQQIQQFGQLQAENTSIDQKLKDHETACKGYTHPDQVPPERSGSAGLNFGQAAMKLGNLLESLDPNQPLSWKAQLDAANDSELSARLERCPDLATLKDCAQARVDELMGFYSTLSERPKVPQERDLLYQRRHQISAELKPLEKALRTLVVASKSDLKKELGPTAQSAAYQELTKE